jgi:Zn-finger nucleic acid-binding protein
MNAVTARANPGTLIQLDQCKQCGGIWCDKWELFPIDPEEADRLEAVDLKLLTAPLGLARTALYCPRCTGKLAVFNDPLLPKEIELQRCSRCEGIWLNRGQLGRYKSHQKKRDKRKWEQPPLSAKFPKYTRIPSRGSSQERKECSLTRNDLRVIRDRSKRLLAAPSGWCCRRS